jgi:hypothetical protein
MRQSDFHSGGHSGGHPGTHSLATRVGYVWVLSAEARPRGARRGSGASELPAEEIAAAGSEWADSLVGAPHINSDRSLHIAVRHGRHVVDWVRWLSESFHSLGWTFGLGFGELTAEKLASGEVELRGEAVERARRSLWKARQGRRHSQIEGVGQTEAQVLASLLDLMGEIRGDWTARQAETVRLARASTGRAVAEALGVSPSVVSESLSAASFRALRRAEDAAGDLFACYGGQAQSLQGETLCFPPTTAWVSATEKAARA